MTKSRAAGMRRFNNPLGDLSTASFLFASRCEYGVSFTRLQSDKRYVSSTRSGSEKKTKRQPRDPVKDGQHPKQFKRTCTSTMYGVQMRGSAWYCSRPLSSVVFARRHSLIRLATIIVLRTPGFLSCISLFHRAYPPTLTPQASSFPGVPVCTISVLEEDESAVLGVSQGKRRTANIPKYDLTVGKIIFWEPSRELGAVEIDAGHPC